MIKFFDTANVEPPVDANGDRLVLDEFDMEVETCGHTNIGHEGPDESVGIFGHVYWCEDCGETDSSMLFDPDDERAEW